MATVYRMYALEVWIHSVGLWCYIRCSMWFVCPFCSNADRVTWRRYYEMTGFKTSEEQNRDTYLVHKSGDSIGLKLGKNRIVTLTAHERHDFCYHHRSDYLFNSLFRLTTRKTSNRRFTYPLREETNRDRWIHLTQRQANYALNDPVWWRHHA